jgi:hypothetical protein
MSSNYKRESKRNGMNPAKKEIAKNTEEWKVVGTCPKLPPLEPWERQRLIRSKGRYR